jgi:hypothetical protein
MEHDCSEHLVYRTRDCAENLDVEVDGAIERWREEWWECALCGELYTERELAHLFGINEEDTLP